MKRLALVAVAACTFPDKEPPAPFACLGEMLPKTANPQVTVSGTVIDARQAIPKPGASVEGFLTSAPTTPIFSTTTDGMVRFTQSQATNGFPLDAFLHVATSGYLDTAVFPPVPLTDDLDVTAELLAPGDLTTLGSLANVTPATGTATLIVTVTDCNGAPLGGATLSASAGGTVRYFVGPMPSETALATDPMTGSALVFNVPPGMTQINAMVNGDVLRGHAVVATADAVVQTSIQP